MGVFALAACAEPAAPRDGGTVDTTPAIAAGAAVGEPDWPAEDACSLLDRSTVGAALGIDVVASELATVVPRTEATAGFSTCFYKLGNGQQVAFMARQTPVANNSPEAIQRDRIEIESVVGGVEDVSGVGKGAFWVPKLRQLVVYLGDDRYFTLTMPRDLGAKDPKTIALGLATRVS